jgi:2-polyprenyl-6-methoxyphenol hydroxylase-like FAD-dependent oxidoreductase
MSRFVPVLIVGGGPSGLAIALELGMHGVNCDIVEPRTTVSDTRPRAKTTNARTMELFRRWGVADDIRAAAALPVSYSNRVTFCTTVTGQEITHFDGVFGLDLTDSGLAAEAGQQVTQPVIERVLRSHVDALPTARLRRGARVTRIEPRPDGVLVHVHDDHDGVEEVLAAQVVGADGPRSIVRTALGAHYEGGDGGRPNVNITFRSRALGDLIPHPASVQYWVLNPASPGVVGPLDTHDLWWAISTGTPSVIDDDHAVRLVRDLVGADVDVDVIATDPWQARMLLADSYGHGRMHLIGDAAHQNPPWGGHGFNTGVGDAVNLGWKLAAVLQGWAPPALLRSYERERRPVAQFVIDAARTNMRTLSIDLTDPEIMGADQAAASARADAAATIQRTKDAEFHSLGLVLGVGYTDAARHQAPAVGTFLPLVVAGARVPHHRFRDGSVLFDRLGAGFTLLSDSADAEPILAEARRRHVPLTQSNRPSADWPPIVLVRPDQIIAYAGDAPEAPQVEAVWQAALSGFPETEADTDRRSPTAPTLAEHGT